MGSYTNMEAKKENLDSRESYNISNESCDVMSRERATRILKLSPFFSNSFNPSDREILIKYFRDTYNSC